MPIFIGLNIFLSRALGFFGVLSHLLPVFWGCSRSAVKKIRTTLKPRTAPKPSEWPSWSNKIQLAQHPPTQLWVGKSLSCAQGRMRTRRECFHSLSQPILQVSTLKEQNTNTFKVGFTECSSLTSLPHSDSALSHNYHCKDHMYWRCSATCF